MEEDVEFSWSFSESDVGEGLDIDWLYRFQAATSDQRVPDSDEKVRFCPSMTVISVHNRWVPSSNLRIGRPTPQLH